MSPSRLLPLIALLLTFPVPARALTIANFQAHWVDNVCAVDDSEPFTAGDPDLRFRMAIFDAVSGSIFAACGAGCFDDGVPSTLDGETLDQCGFVTTCGAWDFGDRLIQKVIPDNRSAYFYFGLFDDDTDADDSMGDHWVNYPSVPIATTAWNNNSSPYYPGVGHIIEVCSDPVAEIGWTNNYRLNYSIWFTDTDGPAPLTAPVARDNGVPVTVDDDLFLNFTWNLTSDPHTGISGYAASLWDDNTGSYVFVNVPVPGGSMTVCASGCTRTYTPVSGHSYQFRVTATNGAFPQINNPTTVFSPWITLLVQNLVGVEEAPAALSLSPPAPNPTKDGAAIAYALPSAGPARVEVIDLQGRRIAVLADGSAAAGIHRIEWDGRNADGRRVESGVYWVRLAFGDARKLQRLVVIR